MAELVFNGAAVAALVLEAKQAKQHTPTFGQRIEWFQQNSGQPFPDDTDQLVKLLNSPEFEAFLDTNPSIPGASGRSEEDLTPPGLLLVKDIGIYLISNGVTGTDQPPQVVYAQGYEADSLPGIVDAAAGGDDLTEYIELTPELDRLDAQHEFVIDLTENALVMGVRERQHLA